MSGHKGRWLFAVFGIGLVLPTISLVPLGGLWLWQQGHVLTWAAIMCALALAMYAAQRVVLRPRPKPASSAQTTRPVIGEAAPDPDWTPAEGKAWSSVLLIADNVKPATLTSREALLELALTTIEAVARDIHPGQKDPLWQFTVPEAMALIEQVSGRLKVGVGDAVPLGDRLTVAQVLKLYRWRSALPVVEQAYDLWRIIRLMNPLTAATNEMREQITKRMMDWGKEELGQRLTRRFVFETGRAAIDLYGGRLRVAGEALATHVSAKSQRDLAGVAGQLAEPLRMVVAGQVSAGKSSLINALLSEVKAAVDVLPATAGTTAYIVKREGQPPTLLIDTSGISGAANSRVDGHAAALKQLMAEVADIDCLIWVVNAARADREVDRAALDALRAAFASRPDRRSPPILLVLSHIDRLRPFTEWAPPYDLTSATSPKAASIKAAMEAAAADLGFSPADIVPVCLDEELGSYNVDAVWAVMAARLPDAQRAQLIRTLRDHVGKIDMNRIWNQTLSAGKALTRMVKK